MSIISIETITSKSLKAMYFGTEKVPDGFRLCEGWGCDAPCGDDVLSVGVENHESGRDISLYVWLEELGNFAR